MKKTLTTLFLLLSFLSYAQKIDLDRERLPVENIILPESAALNGLNTYNVLFYSEPQVLAELGLKDTDLETAFVMIGYTYTKAKEADILLEVTIDRMQVVSESIESRKYDVKNAQGVNVTQTAYFVASNIVAPSYIKLINKQTTTELEYIGVASPNAPIQFKSREFSAYAMAQEYAAKSLISERNTFFLKAYKDQLYATFNRIHTKYCYGFNKNTELFWNIDLKKAPEFADFNAELMKAKTVFEKMTATGSIQPLKAELTPVMNYWSTQASQVASEDKKGRKLKYAYLINLARAQYWMEMFDECNATCKAIVENDYDDLDGKTLLLEVANVKKMLAIHGIQTRHFERPAFGSLEMFRVAGNIQHIPRDPSLILLQVETAPKGYSVLPGYLIDFEQNRIEGELWVRNLDNSETFMPASNTSFVYQGPSGQKKMSVSADNVDKLVLGRTAKFECTLYKNKIGVPEKMQLFRVLYENDKIKVLKLYNSPNGNSNSSLKGDLKQIWSGSELCIMKKSDGIIQPVSGLTVQKTKENVANFYGSCLMLQQKILEDVIKNVNLLEGQKLAADYYAENNCQ
jgi:hypothetical protein